MENQNPTIPVTETPKPSQSVIPDLIGNPKPLNSNPSKPTKKFPLKLIIGIIVFLLLATGAAAGYVSRDKLVSLISKPTPTPTAILSKAPDPSPTPDPAADWNTYEGDGLSFKYPHSYSISNESENRIVSLMSPLNPTPRKGSELLVDELKLEILTPVVTVKGLNQIISEAKQTRNERSNEPLNFEEQNLKIDGIDARKLKTQYSVVYYVIVNNYLYKIIQYPPITSRQSELDQILSTFKFTDKQTIDTSNWKIYTNTNNDYSVKYPSDKFARKLCSGEELVLQQKINGIEDDKITSTCARDGRFDLEIITLKEPFIEPVTNDNFDVEKSTINVGGIQASRYVSIPKRDDCPCYWSTSVKLNNKGKNYLIHFGLKDKTELLDQILSTFKFTN